MITRSCTSLFAGLLATVLFTSVAAAQNVGIGTTTPRSKLSVNGTTASGGMAIGDATYTSTTGAIAPLNGAMIQGRVGIGATHPLMRLHLEGDGTDLNTAPAEARPLVRGAGTGNITGGRTDVKALKEAVAAMQPRKNGGTRTVSVTE